MKKIQMMSAVIFPLLLVTGLVHSETIRGYLECTVCNTTGQVNVETDCSKCDNGYIKCARCHGDGHETCLSCMGHGKMLVRCDDCSGSGRVNGETCGECNGRGKVEEACERCEGDGEYTCTSCGGAQQEECTFCNGDGWIEMHKQCDNCGGKGWVEDNQP